MNARRHGERDLQTLAGSLEKYGQQKPIVVLADGKVIAGNGTLEAARSLGWTHLACVTFDNEDEALASAFAIVDNRTAELSEWDAAVLSSVISGLDGFDIASLGFTDDELAKATALPPLDDLDVEGIQQRTPPTFGEEPKGQPQDGLTKNTNHVRMVHLFLDEKTHTIFMEQVRALSVAFSKETVTDIVFAAVESAFNSHITVKE